MSETGWEQRLADLAQARAEENVRQLLDGPVEPVDILDRPAP